MPAAEQSDLSSDCSVWLVGWLVGCLFVCRQNLIPNIATRWLSLSY